MTEERRIAERRRQIRRQAERAAGAALVRSGPAIELASRTGGDAGFTAQLLGQGGQKRGLRGGPETLNKARSTYLSAEWSGPADRRPHPGTITKTQA